MTSDSSAAGWDGWDAYAPFYDWENRRTIGRRDVRFWTDLARRADGPVLELGCGSGRLSVPGRAWRRASWGSTAPRRCFADFGRVSAAPA